MPLGVNPNRVVTIAPEDNRIVFVEQNKAAISLTNTNEMSVVQTQDGTTLWSERINRIGDTGADPETIDVIWEEGIALIFSRSLTNFQLSAIDLETKSELWNKRESNPGRFSYTGYYLPETGGYMIQTPRGMQAFSVKTGETLWSRPDININVDFGRMLLGQDYSEDIELIFLEETNRFLITANLNMIMLDPNSGESDWEIQRNLGSVLHADIFEQDGFMVFYGHQESSRVTSILGRIEGSELARTGARVARALESGLRLNPLYFVDIQKGEVLWENEFTTNGQSRVVLHGDKLLVTGLVTYAFDINTGEKIWQNVEQSRLDQEAVLSVLSEFTGFDFTASGKSAPEDLIIDNTIFVVYPEIFDEGGGRNSVSIRSYNVNNGEIEWKSDPERITVRDFFLEQGLLFIIGDGRFSRASNLIAFDPYDGTRLYQVVTREPLINLVFTGEKIYNFDYLMRRLTSYNIRNGEPEEVSLLRNRVLDIIDLGDRLFVVYGNSASGSIIAFHDRNTFRLLSQVELPFYSRDHIERGGKFFVNYQSPQFKGIAQVDLENMNLDGYVSAKARWKKTQGDQNVSLQHYHLFVDNMGEYIYKVHKDELSRFRVK